MNRQLARSTTIQPNRSGPILRRSCGCGGACSSCQEKKERSVQRKTAAASGRGSHDFSRVPAGSSVSVRVGPADDRFEREADRVADAVMSGSSLAPRQTGAAQAQRDVDESDDQASSPAPAESASAAGESDFDAGDEADAAESDEEDGGDDGDFDNPTGQPKFADGAGHAGGRVNLPLSATGGGQPLDLQTRGSMEGSIGHDFSGVRVHTGREAADAAASVHARAFTLGSDIYFARGSYQPSSVAGQRLLAHELTHVVQQSGGRPEMVQRAVDDKKKSAKKAKPPAKSEKKTDAPKKKTDAPKKKEKFCEAHGKPCKKPCGPDNMPCDGEDCVPASNPLVKNPCCGNEKCPESAAVDSTFFIRHISVNRKTQMAVAEWGSKSKTESVSTFLTSPNDAKTPPGMHTIGVKCGPCHTNCHGAGMGWFTGFPTLQFGFHNSQKVAKGEESHGCVRVPCKCAKEIHDNTWSGITSVCIHEGKTCGRDLPTFGDLDKAHKSVCADLHVALPPAPKPAKTPAKKPAGKKPAEKKKAAPAAPPPHKDTPVAKDQPVAEMDIADEEEVA